jgi:hypothetical protein
MAAITPQNENSPTSTSQRCGRANWPHRTGILQSFDCTHTYSRVKLQKQTQASLVISSSRSHFGAQAPVVRAERKADRLY